MQFFRNVPNSRAVVTPSLSHLPSFGSQVMQVVGSLLLEEKTDPRPDNPNLRVASCEIKRLDCLLWIPTKHLDHVSAQRVSTYIVYSSYVRGGQLPADEVASPVEAVRAVHPDEAILRSFDCPGWCDFDF